MERARYILLWISQTNRLAPPGLSGTHRRQQWWLPFYHITLRQHTSQRPMTNDSPFTTSPYDNTPHNNERQWLPFPTTTMTPLSPHHLTTTHCYDKVYVYLFSYQLQREKRTNKRRGNMFIKGRWMHGGAYIICRRQTTISYLWLDKIQGRTLTNLSISLNPGDRSDPARPPMTISGRQNHKKADICWTNCCRTFNPAQEPHSTWNSDIYWQITRWITIINTGEMGRYSGQGDYMHIT